MSFIASLFGGGKKEEAPPPPPPMPTPPTPEAAVDNAEDKKRKKVQAVNRSKSVYTSPLGIGGEAQIAQKTLLGQ